MQLIGKIEGDVSVAFREGVYILGDAAAGRVAAYVMLEEDALLIQRAFAALSELEDQRTSKTVGPSA